MAEEYELESPDGLRKGDLVVVVDDTDPQRFGHNFTKGEQLVLHHWDPTDDSWWAGRTSVGSGGYEEAWIAEADIMREPSVTDEEVDAAIQSIMKAQRW